MTWLGRITALSVALVSFPLSAQSPSAPTSTVPAARLLARAGNVLTTIRGNALTSTDDPLSGALLRLRDARSGRIVASQTTDKAGLFSFGGVEPGTYVVEVMVPDGSTVLAASELLTVNAGDTASAIVKLPLRVPPYAAVTNSAGSRASLGALIALAASSGVAAIAASGDATCPLQ